MTQTRLHLRASRPAAAAVFARLEVEFEEQGLALAIVEIDEETGIDEISVYTDETDVDDVETRLQFALSGLVDEPVIHREALDDIDWVSKSLEGLQPVRVGRFLVHGAHDRDKLRTGDIGIEIEAGRAFGTGHHGTTAGCLELIADILRRERPANALDLGTGSAVLAIAIARAARIRVLATDIDPVATAIAAQNARLNHVHAFVETVTATGFHHPSFSRRGAFDLIVANILAGPLMTLAPAMAHHTAPGGSLILSGILERQRDAVVAAYVNQSFRHLRTIRREGWVAIHLKR